MVLLRRTRRAKAFPTFPAFTSLFSFYFQEKNRPSPKRRRQPTSWKKKEKEFPPKQEKRDGDRPWRLRVNQAQFFRRRRNEANPTRVEKLLSFSSGKRLEWLSEMEWVFQHLFLEIGRDIWFFFFHRRWWLLALFLVGAGRKMFWTEGGNRGKKAAGTACGVV